MTSVRTIGLVPIAAFFLLGCEPSPATADSADSLRSPAKTSACVTWCEREKAAQCPGQAPSLDDCGSHCAGEAGCGDASPLLTCLDGQGAALTCVGESAATTSVVPPAECFAAFKAYYDALPACKPQSPPDVGSGPRRDR